LRRLGGRESCALLAAKGKSPSGRKRGGGRLTHRMEEAGAARTTTKRKPNAAAFAKGRKPALAGGRAVRESGRGF